MPDDDPLGDFPLHVGIAEQIIIGFDQAVGRLAPAAALERIHRTLTELEHRGFPTELLSRFVPPKASDTIPFAVALVRLKQGTFEELRDEVGDKERYRDVGWVERNASISPAFNDLWFVQKQQWALVSLGVKAAWTVAPPGAPTIVAIVD